MWKNWSYWPSNALATMDNYNYEGVKEWLINFQQLKKLLHKNCEIDIYQNQLHVVFSFLSYVSYSKLK